MAGHFELLVNMPKKDSKKAKKEKKVKSSKKVKKPKKEKSASMIEPPPATASSDGGPTNRTLPLGLGMTWTPEDEFLTGQIFERFSKGRGMMTASECCEALSSMGFNQSRAQPTLFLRPEAPGPKVDTTPQSSGNELFQTGYMSLEPWWISNDKLLGGTRYQGADLALAEASRRRAFTEKVTGELDRLFEDRWG